MTARLRPRGPAARRHERAIGASVALLVLCCIALGVTAGRLHGSDRADSSRPESFGAPGHAPSPLALMSSRAGWLPAGLADGRQRAAQLLAPGAPDSTGVGLGLRSAANAMSPRPPHLVLLGLLAVRAPPTSYA
jgi:hypothetical protein